MIDKRYRDILDNLQKDMRIRMFAMVRWSNSNTSKKDACDSLVGTLYRHPDSDSFSIRVEECELDQHTNCHLWISKLDVKEIEVL